jgi:hypothetical protein
MYSEARPTGFGSRTREVWSLRDESQPLALQYFLWRTSAFQTQPPVALTNR